MRSRLAYALVLAAALCCYAALGAVVAILPSYVPQTLGGGSTAVGLCVGAPALTGVLARPFGGRLADRIGPRRVLIAGAVVMAVATLPSVASSTLGALVASRLAVGLGEGVMMSAGVLWLLRLVGPERRGRALGHIGLANFGGLTLGPLVAAVAGGAGHGHYVVAVAVVLPLLGAAAAAVVSAPARDASDEREGDRVSAAGLRRQTARAGLGLLLVNVGYVSVLSFGAAVSRQHSLGLDQVIVPLFAGVVLVSRTVGGAVPDRLGGRRTALVFAGTEAAGLLVFALARSPALGAPALVVLSVGQSLAVPGLGLLALAGVPPERQGAAAGLFFAWFDAGVGLGGPAVGALAAVAGPPAALVGAAVAVGGVCVLVALRR